MGIYIKVFISWSGDTSQKIALIFREWLPSVIQEIEPYVSSEDIDKGSRWSTDISGELDVSSFGLICVTKENINAPWINFEAGALSKQIDKSFVSPFLFDMKRSEVNGPLLQFQSTVYEKKDILKLIKSINYRCGDGCLNEKRLESIFEVWWPNLKDSLDNLSKNTTKSPSDKDNKDLIKLNTSDDILEEMLELLRNQHKLLRNPEMLLPLPYLREAMNVKSQINRIAIKDLDIYFRMLTELIIKYDKSGAVPLDEIDVIRRKLSKPINYLIRKNTTIKEIKPFDSEVAMDGDWDVI